MRLGKIRGTDTLNGTRYLDMRDVQGPVPVDLNADEFPIRVFCDNGKTECKHCSLTTHPSYRCPVKPKREGRCYRCLSTSHNINECSNEIVCKFCSQSGHKEKQCDNKREIEVFGDYRHEINEGRRDSFEDKLFKDKNVIETPNGSSENSKSTIPKQTDYKSDDAKPQQQQQHQQLQQQHQQQQQQHNHHNEQQETNGSNKQSNRSDRNKCTTECENLVLGDSLLNHIAEPEGWVISNEAGATLSKTDQLIEKASERLETQLYPDCLLIQLGTNDLAYNKLSATEIITKYTDIIANVKNRFTQSKIGVCSIPPCKGKGEDIKLCNDTAKAVNTYLETLTKVSPDQMIFIDTWAAFWSQRNGQAIAKFYVNNDHKSVHLNKSGKDLLMSVIVNKICATSAKRKSSNNLSPVNKNPKEPRIGSTDGITLPNSKQS